MAGRVYDPLAARFTTADPIMQAPYWSQGQNRYAYVFNDPLNNTDPSGFMSSSEFVGGMAPVIIGVGITGGTFLATRTADLSPWSIGGGVTGGTLNGVQTLLTNPFGGSGGGTYGVAAPSGAPNANPVKPGGIHALGQASPPSGAVQERADQLQESIESFDEAQDAERLAQRMPPRRRPRGAPMPGGGGPVLRPMPPQPRIPVLLPRLAPGRSFPSHRAFVNWAGRAGDGMSWHHIVEQNDANVARFGAARIHTTGNYYRLSNHVHSQINEFYSKPNFALTGSRTMTVRQWIAPQSYENHQTLGEFALQLFLGQ